MAFQDPTPTIVPSIKAAAIAGIICWMSYYLFYLNLFPGIIEQWWHRNIIEGLSLGGVPVEELIWAMMAGLFIGPVSRYFLVPE